MAIDRKRLLGLALERLQAERDQIDREIAEIRTELKSPASAPKQSTTRKRPKLTAKERKARSERMKKYWADKKNASKK